MAEDASTAFLITGRLWCLARFPRATEPGAVFRTLRLVEVSYAGATGMAVPVYTDLDLAERALRRMDDGGRYQPLAFETAQDFAAAMAELMRSGQTRVVFDPEPGEQHGRLFDIAQVVDGIARGPV